MKKQKEDRLFRAVFTAKPNDNVICYVKMGVVL